MNKTFDNSDTIWEVAKPTEVMRDPDHDSLFQQLEKLLETIILRSPDLDHAISAASHAYVLTKLIHTQVLK